MNLAEYYDNYWRQIGETFDMTRLQLISERVGPGENVLEVDCGPGVMAALMRERGARVTGTDLSAVAVERAREKGFDVTQVDLDTETLPFPDEAFDTVVSNSAIEHRFFYDRSLDECVRVLRRGGKFILCLPNIAHWRCRLWLLAGRFPYVRNSPTDMTHLRFFTVHDAKALCASRGIEVLEVDGSASLWVKGFYPSLLRRPIVRDVYTWLARRWPSMFARDFVILGRKR
ncbi:MAG: class I SAM-dependent methyltransferase [Chloroflexi bacterium]|nr:class I SAM-dependent methyltransferase [Chloroflexota bacterium]